MSEQMNVQSNEKDLDEQMVEQESELSLAALIAERRIEKVNAQPRSVKQMARNPQSLNFSAAVQRNLRWSDEQKSELIESAILGYPIPPVYSLRSEDKQLWLYDGKQRLTTLISFVNGEWPLTELPELDDVFGYAAEGQFFADLPKEFQELIEDTQVVIYQFEHLTEHQRDQLFKRLNSGTPLTNIELLRSVLGTANLDYIRELSETPFFQLVAMSDKQVDKFVHQELLLQIIGLITGQLTDLSGENLRHFAIALRDRGTVLDEHGEKQLVVGVSEDERAKIANLFTYLDKAFTPIEEKKRNRVLKKSDIIGIIGAALGVECDPILFGTRVTDFVLKPPQAYKDAKRQGSAKETSIRKRIDMLKAAAENNQ